MNRIESDAVATPAAAIPTAWLGIPLLAFGIALSSGAHPAWAAAPTTVTTLAVSADGISATTVAWGTVVTLTATVKSASTPITTGRVSFCDASAAYCTDVHLLGTAQLTGAASATMSFVPPIGNHNYKAVFAGTRSDATSTSGTVSLDVSGPYPTTAAVEMAGTAGDYELVTTVTGWGTAAPTGTVAYLDTNNQYALLGTAELSEGTTEPLSFKQSFAQPATGGSLAVAAGDFDGDGLTDLAIVDTIENTVAILLGNGDGTFTQATASPNTGAIPIAVAVGDFNRDGIPDLAVLNNVNGGAGSVTVLLGNGDGTFTPTATTTDTGTDPVSIVANDFNHDGILDLAVLNNANGHAATITVLLGNGDGTFKATATSPQTNSFPSFLAVGDFNGDGIPDLAVTSYADQAPGTLSIFIGNGDGTFNPSSVKTTVGFNPSSIAVADFNGDGKTDLAVMNTGEDTATGTVTVLLGKGNGTFTSSTVNLTVGQQFNSIAAGDFNGDRIPDLAVSAAGVAGETTVLLGNGAGSFTVQAAAAALGAYPTTILAVDLNGEGNAAIVSGEGVLLAQRAVRARALADQIEPIGASTPHIVEAVYSGDSSNAGSTSATIQLLGTMLTPSVRLLSSADSATSGTTVTLTSTIAGSLTLTGNLPAPTGSVLFYEGSLPLATVAIGSGGVSTWSSSALSIGEHIFTAVYPGDDNYFAAVSGAITVTIAPRPAATIQLKSSVSSVVSGKPVAFTATAAGKGPRPTGSVSFYSGKVLLCGGALNLAGEASCSSSKLGVGKDSVTASYAGDEAYAATTSKPVIVAVTAP
jgi:hypothetical protein